MSNCASSSCNGGRGGCAGAGGAGAGGAGDGHLPLILCPRCGRCMVETNIKSRAGTNQGKRFYKCPHDEGKDACRWFKWEEQYVPFVQAAAAAVDTHPRPANLLPAAAPAPSPTSTDTWTRRLTIAAILINTLVNLLICIVLFFIIV